VATPHDRRTDSPAPVLVRGPTASALVPHLLDYIASSLVVLGIAPEGRTVRVTLRRPPDGDTPVPGLGSVGAALAR
jgi:hypothetical protein